MDPFRLLGGGDVAGIGVERGVFAVGGCMGDGKVRSIMGIMVTAAFFKIVSKRSNAKIKDSTDQATMVSSWD